MKRILWPIFSYYRVWQTPRDNLKGSKRYSNIYCVSYKIVSVKPKGLLKTQMWKKGSISCDKFFVAYFLS